MKPERIQPPTVTEPDAQKKEKAAKPAAKPKPKKK
jgi:hypothetical protein